MEVGNLPDLVRSPAGRAHLIKGLQGDNDILHDRRFKIITEELPAFRHPSLIVANIVVLNYIPEKLRPTLWYA